MKELIDGLRRGDQAALGDLYDQTSALVHGLCLRIVRDPLVAEELTLDVFMQAWNQAAAYDPARGTPEAWLLVIARSRALDWVRSARNARAQSEASLDVLDALGVEPAAPESSESGAMSDRRRIVAAALEHVSVEEREVLGCAYFRGMSHSEIASFLKQPLGTVKSRVRSGLMKLRRSLAPLAAGGVSW
jgi:RNA polymerase sigma-70 factor, ECF subfamily